MKKLFLFLCYMVPFAAFGQMVSLTLKVDMRNETIHPNGVHVAGNFQAAAGLGSDWNPGSTMLEDPNGDQVFERTVMLPPGTYLYKFVNGNAWEHKPELPTADCAVGDGGGNFNRQVTIGLEGVNLPVVQFDSCNAILHFAINMSNESVPTAGAHVMGDFQEAAGFPTNWDPTSIPLVDGNADGTYEAQIQVPPGDYQYRFVNGNTIVEAESLSGACANAEGNRSITLAIGDNPGPVYCFNSCQLCDPSINTNYETYWWNDAVFYEIFVRSFYDSDGDGIGDFQGIIEKLDYLNDGDPNTDTDLGITGIWLMPMMTSPSYHGYDVTDYYDVEPDYGTMEDFEAFLDAAHARGIKVIIDFVMNHSSSQHPWFLQSAANQNDYRDWYVWSDTDPGFSGPWGQQVWHNRNGDYYYGLFWGGMPDLNYDHPPVKEELFNITEFWMEKGIDGFRLDAIKYLDENGNILENTTETFQILEEFNTVYKTANPEAFTVGEVWSTTASIVPYVQNDRLDVCFDFDLAYSIINGVQNNNPDPIQNHLQVLQSSYAKLQYATFLTNHDIDRIYNQFNENESRMKLAASIYLTLPGIPFIYYGEELGMLGTKPDENIRRPMQWNDATHAGFSTTTPWYGVGANYPTNNVADMENNPNSLLSHYKKLIHIRNAHAPLRKGYLLNLESSNDNLLSFARIYEEEAILVVSNMTNSTATVDLSLALSSLPAGSYQVTELINNTAIGSIGLNSSGGFEGLVLPNIGPRTTWIIALASETVSTNSIAKQEPLFSIAPNPVSDWLQLTWLDETIQALPIQVFNASGQLMHTHTLRQSATSLNIADLPAGLYFIRSIYQGKVQVKEFVKGE